MKKDEEEGVCVVEGGRTLEEDRCAAMKTNTRSPYSGKPKTMDCLRIEGVNDDWLVEREACF